jgi:hypothetical protein
MHNARWVGAEVKVGQKDPRKVLGQITQTTKVDKKSIIEEIAPKRVRGHTPCVKSKTTQTRSLQYMFRPRHLQIAYEEGIHEQETSSGKGISTNEDAYPRK